MADARNELALYVAGGNLRNHEQAATDIALQQDRLAALRGRLGRWREDVGQTIVTPEANPADFRAALEAADERAYQRSLTEQGRDIPRIEPQNPTAAKILNRVYQAHDTVVGLPTPSGLGTIILIIVVLFLILIPATGRGETRALLLWDVLLGRKQLPDTTPQNVPAGSSPQNLITQAALTAAITTQAAAGAAINETERQIEQQAANIASQIVLGLGGL